MLRVAYYLNRFPNLTETFILREMLSLRKIGFHIDVFSMFPPEKTPTMHQQVEAMLPYAHYSPYLSSEVLKAQAYFIRKSPRKYARAWLRAVWQAAPDRKDLAKTLLLFPKSVYFARQLEAMRIDHIHAHFVSINAILAQAAADLLGITHSVHAHAYDIFQRNPLSVRRTLELATAVVTVSGYHRDYIARLCPRLPKEKIHVVHYGIDPAEFHPVIKAGVGQAEPVHILSVASLVEKKGHEYLIDACGLLAKRGCRFDCTIVGGGYLRDALQERINAGGLQNIVRLTGPCNQTEVQSFFRQGDIFALACVVARDGDRDGMPNVLLEGMASVLPVVTTPVTGNVELVQDNINGLLVPERDPQALALALERLISAPALRAQLGANARQTVLNAFDIAQTSCQMGTLFQLFHTPAHVIRRAVEPLS